MKRVIALFCVSTTIFACAEGNNNSSSEPQAQQSESQDKMSDYLVGNLSTSQVDTINSLGASQLGDRVLLNTQTVLLIENNKILQNLVGVIDAQDSLRIMRLTAQSHGYILSKKE